MNDVYQQILSYLGGMWRGRWYAVAALGGVEPEETLAMVSVAETSRRVLLSPSPASLATPDGGVRQWFRLAHPAVQEGSALARFVGDTMGLDSLVVAGGTSPSSTALRAVIERAMVARGVTIVDLPASVSAETDETVLVETVRSIGAAAVLLLADSQSAGEAVRTLEGAGFDGAILASSAFVVGDDASEIAALARGIFVPLPAFDVAAMEGSQGAFGEAFRRRYGKPPSLCAANGYDAMTMLLEALRRGGLTPAGVWKGLRSIRDFPGTRRSLQFDERGEILDFPRIHRIEGEAMVDYEDWLGARRVEIEAQIRLLREQRLRLLEELGG